MGISGLLPFLKDATTSVHIKQFEGATVAVDTYCWIYRGAFSCAEDLAMGHPTDGHVKYVLKYVKKLLEWNIKPIMVFDGSCLPSKKMTEQKRKESKEMYRNKARQCLSEGRVNEARECFQRCIECTPKMALEVIKALHAMGVDVVVAPYEADAQLTYLNKIHVAQIVITEDSDLVLFGCEKILYKLDINGNGQLIEKEKIISITQFDSANSFEKFRWMCILSGCDYLENLPGIGLGKAKKFLKSIQKTDLEQLLKQMPKVLKMPNLIVSNEYIEKFIKADKTFKYQIVFDPLKRKLASLHEYQGDVRPEEDISFAGVFYDNEQALQHSLGNLDVNSHSVVNDFDPETWNYKPPLKYSTNPPAHMRSVWSKHYRTFKSSNPFSSFLVAPAVTKEPQSVSRPLTVGKTRTLSNSSFTITTTTSSQTKDSRRKSSGALSQSDSTSKRKFDSISEVRSDEIVLYSGGCSSEASSSSSYESSSSGSNQDARSADDKRLRMEKAGAVLGDIDELLTQYSTDNASQASKKEIDSSPLACESSQTTSSYFSAVSISANSPILTTKLSQKFSVPSQSKSSLAALFSKDINQDAKFSKLETSGQEPLRLKIIEDLSEPLSGKKADHQAAETEEGCQESEKISVVNSDVIRKFSSSSSSFRFKQTAQVEETPKMAEDAEDKENQKDAPEDIESGRKSPLLIGSRSEPITVNDSPPPPTSKLTKSAASSKKISAKAKPVEANSRPITEFFAKFQFTKTSSALQTQ